MFSDIKQTKCKVFAAVCNCYVNRLSLLCCVSKQILSPHTHPFNGNLSGTTQVSQYQKCKTNLHFTETREVSGSGISWAVCKSASCSRQPCQHPTTQFLQAGHPSCQPTNSVKAPKVKKNSFTNYRNMKNIVI